MAHPCALRKIIMAMSIIMSTCIFVDECHDHAPGPPTFTSRPGDLPSIGQTLSLSCSLTGHVYRGQSITLLKNVQNLTTPIAYQYHRNGCEATPNLRAGAWVTPCQNEIWNLTVVIPNVQPTDSAEYICDVTTADKNWNNTSKESKNVTIIGASATPSDLRVVDVTARSITLSWTSESSGGSPQKFHVKFHKRSSELWPENDQIVNIDDPGYKSTVRYRISDLDPLTTYDFGVRSSNQHYCTNKSAYTFLYGEQTLDLPKTEDLWAYRVGNEITVSWRQPIGTYTGVTIEYCITATTVCSNYSVPDISYWNTATLAVDEFKTYIYYLHLLQSDVVVFTSPPFHAVQAPIETCNTSFIVISVGFGLLIIGNVVISIALWCRWIHTKSQKHEIIMNCNNEAPPTSEYLSLNNYTTPQCSVNDLRTSDAQNPCSSTQVNVATYYEVPITHAQQPADINIYTDVNDLTTTC